VLGRTDDVIVTGGIKVAPGPVEEALGSLTWVREAVVVGVPDAEWGQAVVALVTLHGDDSTPWSQAREVLAESLDRTHIPRVAHAVDVLPRLSSGKIDRAAARTLAATLTAERGSHGQHE
jgi:O-succinylbenzoic acid--CoA ligase